MKANKTIEEVANEYVSQNNRGTAFPYALLVIEEELVSSEDGEVIGIYSPNAAEMYYYDSLKPTELLHELKDLSVDDEYAIDEIEEIFNDISCAEDLLQFYRRYIDLDARLYTFNREYVRKGEQMFLTESSAKAHIDMNGHNMKKPITYGIHIFRNLDMELIIQDLMKKATLPIEQLNDEAKSYFTRKVLEVK
jgi:hypothetical protein